MKPGDRVQFNGLYGRSWETTGTIETITGEFAVVKWDAGKDGYLHQSQLKTILPEPVEPKERDYDAEFEADRAANRYEKGMDIG